MHSRCALRFVTLVLGLVLGLTTTQAASAERTLTVTLEPGSAYSHTVKLGLFSMTTQPQMAIWIETAEGRFVDTVYVTDKAATGSWMAAGGSLRPESLPIWSHARGPASNDGRSMPDKKSRLPDSISGATPKAAFHKEWRLPASLEPGEYKVLVELNSSYDWNEAYPDKLPKSDPRWSEVNGQPSIVWEAMIDLGTEPVTASLAPMGTGALRGEDGELRAGLDGLTSALDIAASISAVYRP
jgi:Predicted periplasmic protein (DUF2271).